MPTPSVPNVGRVAAKWARRVGGAAQDYAEGVRGASGKWQAAATAGAKNYQDGVTQAATQGRFARGVARAGDAKWQRNAQGKGADRYGPGAAAAEGDFSAAIGPVLEVIGRTDLPARGPKGSEGNYQRSTVVARALRAFATKV